MKLPMRITKNFKLVQCEITGDPTLERASKWPKKMKSVSTMAFNIAVLLASAEKWACVALLHKIFTKEEMSLFDENGPFTCAACDAYQDTSCMECPINTHTGNTGCDETPYGEYCEKPCYNTALKEMKFLLSLIPKELSK